MKRAYAKSSYAKPYEQYCREKYAKDSEQIFAKAEKYYLALMRDARSWQKSENLSMAIGRNDRISCLKKRIGNIKKCRKCIGNVANGWIAGVLCSILITVLRDFAFA